MSAIALTLPIGTHPGHRFGQNGSVQKLHKSPGRP